MTPVCETCGAKKVPVEENTFACPSCGQEKGDIPHTCDYCHEHVASAPSADGAWICEYCSMAAIVRLAAFPQILAVQTRLAKDTGHEISLHDTFTTWRQSAENAKVNPTSPVSEVNAHAS